MESIETIYRQIHLNTIICMATKINQNFENCNSHIIIFVLTFIVTWELFERGGMKASEDYASPLSAKADHI